MLNQNQGLTSNDQYATNWKITLQSVVTGSYWLCMILCFLHHYSPAVRAPSGGQLGRPLHNDVSHTESKAVLRSAQVLSASDACVVLTSHRTVRECQLMSSFQALSGHHGWQRAILPQRDVQHPHVPGSGQGSGGQPHSTGVSEYTEVQITGHGTNVRMSASLRLQFSVRRL